MRGGEDMRVNRQLILELRRQRSWSQDELANAAGLNLRTVQRIERSGSASLQSRRALAAAFEIDASALDEPEEIVRYEYRVLRFDMKWSGLGGKFGTDFDAVEDQMNVLGADGWELVKISEILGAGVQASSTAALVATFKRPLSD